MALPSAMPPITANEGPSNHSTKLASEQELACLIPARFKPTPGQEQQSLWFATMKYLDFLQNSPDTLTAFDKHHNDGKDFLKIDKECRQELGKRVGSGYEGAFSPGKSLAVWCLAWIREMLAKQAMGTSKETEGVENEHGTARKQQSENVEMRDIRAAPEDVGDNSLTAFLTLHKLLNISDDDLKVPLVLVKLAEEKVASLKKGSTAIKDFFRKSQIGRESLQRVVRDLQAELKRSSREEITMSVDGLMEFTKVVDEKIRDITKPLETVKRWHSVVHPEKPETGEPKSSKTASSTTIQVQRSLTRERYIYL